MFEYYDRNDAGCLDYKAWVKDLLSSKSQQPSVYRPQSQQSDTSRQASIAGDRHRGAQGRAADGIRRPHIDIEAEIDRIIDSLKNQLLKQGLFSLIRFGKNLKVRPSI